MKRQKKEKKIYTIHRLKQHQREFNSLFRTKLLNTFFKTTHQPKGCLCQPMLYKIKNVELGYVQNVIFSAINNRS